MNKPVFFALVLAAVALCPAAAATGIGVRGDLCAQSNLPAERAAALSGGASLTVASDALPWVFALQARPCPAYVGFTADNWVVYQPLSDSLSGYLFWGISGGAGLQDALPLNTGARLGAGLNLFLCRHRLELYAEAAWNPSFGVNLDTADADRFFVLPLAFPAGAGLRLWW